MQKKSTHLALAVYIGLSGTETSSMTPSSLTTVRSFFLGLPGSGGLSLSLFPGTTLKKWVAFFAERESEELVSSSDMITTFAFFGTDFVDAKKARRPVWTPPFFILPLFCFKDTFWLWHSVRLLSNPCFLIAARLRRS